MSLLRIVIIGFLALGVAACQDDAAKLAQHLLRVLAVQRRHASPRLLRGAMKARRRPRLPVGPRGGMIELEHRFVVADLLILKHLVQTQQRTPEHFHILEISFRKLKRQKRVDGSLGDSRSTLKEGDVKRVRVMGR